RAIKVWKERQEEQLVSFDRIPCQCEICQKTICLYSLMKHYSQVHGVQEDCWSCNICEKEFKRREYWISHMDVQHAGVGVDIDELLKEAVKMNVKDKFSLKILNAERKRVRGGRKERKNQG
ncbi:Transcriptional regulator ADR1, partial [Orchesella cincta]